MIRIKREYSYTDSARAYKIFIDGTLYGKIRANETKIFEVEKGRHSVIAKIDWGSSNLLYINVADSIVDLEVGTNLTGIKSLFSLVYAILFPEKWILLREIECIQEQTN